MSSELLLYVIRIIIMSSELLLVIIGGSFIARDVFLGIR